MADAGRTLSDTLRHFGLDSLTSQPDLWRTTLRNQLADRPHESALLLAALEAGVPTRLSTESRSSDVGTVVAQLARGLEQSNGLPPEAARWAVQTWAQALDPSSTWTSPPSRPPGTSVNSQENATVLRTPSGAFTAPQPPPPQPPPPQRPPDAFTAPQRPPGVFTAPQRPPDAFTAPPPPSGPLTVLRAGPGAGTAPLPPSATSTSGQRNGGSGRRRLVVVGVVVLVAVIIGVAVFVLRGSGDGPTPTAFASISPVLAHRGDHEGYPQETLPAFLQAARRGFTVETDVRWTKDGVPIINHDVTTGLGMVCRGGPYVVSKTSWAVLRSSCHTAPSASKTHRSYGIPTFAATVEQLSKIRGATLFAELKVDQTPAQNKQYLAILRKWHMVPRTVATSYFSAYLVNFGKEVTREGVKIRTLRFASANAPTTLADLRRTHVWGAVFEQGWDMAPALMRGARKVDIHVGLATVTAPGDGPTQWSRAKKLGAQFVLTDRPVAYHSWRAKH